MSFLILKTVSIPIIKSEIKNDNAPINDNALALQLYEQMVIKFIPIINIYIIKTAIIEGSKEYLDFIIQMIDIIKNKTINTDEIIMPGLINSYEFFINR